MADFSIKIRGLWGRIRDLGAIGVYLWGRKQQEHLDDEEYERTRRTWTWMVGMEKHSFTGTPAEYRRYKADSEPQLSGE